MTREAPVSEPDDGVLTGLLDKIPALAGQREVAELPGGLTSRNYKVTVGGSS